MFRKAYFPMKYIFIQYLKKINLCVFYSHNKACPQCRKKPSKKDYSPERACITFKMELYLK